MSLVHNVSTLLKEPVGSSREFDVDDRVLLDEGSRHQQVAGHVKLLRTKDGVLVGASVDGASREACSRCLREVEVPVHAEFEEEFLASVDATGVALPPPEDSEAFRIDPLHNLDIEEAVRQSWAVAQPMQPLCRPDCRGLCPRCGQDLNETSCSCQPEEDERWSALRELAGKTEGR